MSGAVLIADGDRKRAGQVASACADRGFAARRAAHGAAALESALAEVPDVVVAPFDLDLIDGRKLAEILRANPRTQAVRFVLLGSSKAGASEGGFFDEVMASDSDVDEIAMRVESIVHQRERMDAAWKEAEAEHQVQGRLSQIPLTDLLQLFHMNRRTGRIELLRRDPAGREEGGTIWIREGNLLQAAVGQVEGEKALFRLLAWKEGSFAFTPNRVNVAARILTPTRALLMEGMRQLDEWDRLRSQLPPLDGEVVLKVKSSEIPNVVHPLTQEVLLLLEIYTAVQDVVDHCSHPDYQVLRTLQTLLEKGLIEIRHGLAGPGRSGGETLFSANQIRRLRDWLQAGVARGATPGDAKLLLASPEAGTTRDFVRLLAGLPGMKLSETFRRGEFGPADLVSVGRLSLDASLAIEVLHVPADPGFAAIWPVAAHRALGTLLLLPGVDADAEQALRPLADVVRGLPRARLFHVMLLPKGERLSAEEVQARLPLLEEASLFLISAEGGRDPVSLLGAMLGRVVP